MVRAAVAEEPGFCVDERELHRDGASYSVDTLESLRADFPGRSLALLIGLDAFLGKSRGGYNLKKPQGVSIHKGKIYVADTQSSVWVCGTPPFW